MEEEGKAEEEVQPESRQGQDEILTCEFCSEYSGTFNQVRAHKINCKSNPAKIKAMEAAAKFKPEPKAAPAPPPPARKERIPFGSPQRRLRHPEGDGFHYRVFNDNWRKEPGRIKRALEAGYEIVDNWKPVSVGTNDDGSEIKGILMRIPEEFYKEDQKMKLREVDKVDKAIKGGTIEQQAGDKRYIPDGIKIWSNQNENG